MYIHIILFMLIIPINYISFNALHIAKDRPIFLLEQEIIDESVQRSLHAFDM